METEERSRRQRGLARLAELDDEPGGEKFLASLGDLGDYTVDFAFGDVHCREGLSVRDRELVILAVLTSLGGLDPQVRAHIRAARAAGASDREIEETIIQTTPYAGFPRAINGLKILREEQQS
ncbi:MAG: carboxymuconolactone decarboxylase family protein [Actinomycetota bacterium]|nr:carboxymuconolactone decarboxylase family protein [Actinomycetota bacterium]